LKKSLKKSLIEKYKEYCTTAESFAVLFVKKYLRAAEGKWIDILDFEIGRYNEIENLEFEYVTCELFQKELKPEYPPRKIFATEKDYILACRAVTWETAHEDIDAQRQKNIHGVKYALRGKKVAVKNENYTGEYFVKDAPEEIKTLAKNLNDTTDPLWDIAFKYVNHEEEYFYEYKLVSVKRLQEL